MLRFKQFLIESSGHNSISNQIQNILNLVGLDANTKKNLTDLQTELDSTHRSYNQEDGFGSESRARKSRYAEQMRGVESRVSDIGDSEPIRNLSFQNLRVKSEKNLDPGDHRIDTSLPQDLQQLQQSNRKASFERSGLVAPHPEVTKPVSMSPHVPTLSDLEELEKLGVVDAKNYRRDERGILYRPGSLPSEAQRTATARKATDVANLGGGLVTANTPEAKERRADAVRDYYSKHGKYSDRLHTIMPDETGQQWIDPRSSRRFMAQFDKATDAAKNLGAAGLAAAGSIAGSALTQGVQAATDVLGMVGTTPTGKDRMQIEKSFNSDLGLGFDLGPDGELEMNPAGREAARKRQQSGTNFPSMFQK